MGSTTELIKKLFDTVEAGQLGSSQKWGGAGMVVAELGAPNSDRHKVLRTTNPEQLSWLLVELTKIMGKEEGFGIWKHEYYGRLANRCDPLANNSLDEQCLAMLHETLLFLQELHSDQPIEIVTIAFGNEIADDHIGGSQQRSSLSMKEVKTSIGHLLTGKQ